MTNPSSLIFPIRVSANGRYFVDANNRPFFWLGDTAWPFFTQYPIRDAEHYLEDRATKGFNVVQGVLAWSGGTGFEQRTPGPNEAGFSPWDADPSHPNEAFFQSVDHLLKKALDLGVILAVLPAWGYFINDIRSFTPENAQAYGRWLGIRYKDQPNIVWVNGGDRIPNGSEDIYRSMARGLREGDEGRHLITYHPSGWHSSSQFFHEEAWLDFNMIQTWTEWAKVYPAVLTDQLMQPAKPVVLGEGAYENGTEYPQGPITPLVLRRQAWWTFMAGGFYTNGHRQMWKMDPCWTDSFDSPGAWAVAQFKQIATSRDWWKRIPDQGMFASGIGCERTLNTAIRSVDSNWAMLYLSSQCHVLVHLDKLLTQWVKATWVNPANGGEMIDAGTYATGNKNGKIFPEWRTQWFSTPPFWEDAVLLLDGF